jgi:hypothetical protein
MGRREPHREPQGHVTLPRVAYGVMCFTGAWLLTSAVLVALLEDTNLGLAGLVLGAPIGLLALFLSWGCWAQGGYTLRDPLINCW